MLHWYKHTALGWHARGKALLGADEGNLWISGIDAIFRCGVLKSILLRREQKRWSSREVRPLGRDQHIHPLLQLARSTKHGDAEPAPGRKFTKSLQISTNLREHCTIPNASPVEVHSATLSDKHSRSFSSWVSRVAERFWLSGGLYSWSALPGLFLLMFPPHFSPKSNCNKLGLCDGA